MHTTRLALVLFPLAVTPIRAQQPPVTDCSPRWTYAYDVGGGAVSLGWHGTQVLFQSNHGPGYQTSLFSSFDEQPPQAVWQHSNPPLNENGIASADESDAHAVATWSGGVTSVRLHGPEGEAPRWTYVHPVASLGWTPLGIAPDGSTVVVAITRADAEGRCDVLRLDGATGDVLASVEVPAEGVGGAARGFDLADGGRYVALSLSESHGAYIVDLDAGAIVFRYQGVEPPSEGGIGISGDGAVLALHTRDGLDTQVRIFELDSRGWMQTYARPGGDKAIGGRVAVSRDGCTVVSDEFAVHGIQRVWVTAVDVPTKTVTMSDYLESGGPLWLRVEDIDICDDGSRFVVAEAGEEPGLVPEVRVYARDQDRPLCRLNLPGSARTVDMSSDGVWVVAESRAMHIGQTGSGGRVDLLHVGGADLDLRGAPRLGAGVECIAYAQPGEPVVLGVAAALADPPVWTPGGWLFLELAGMRALPMGTADGSGRARLELALPSEAGLAGTTTFLQAWRPGPRWTRTWIPLTFLP